VPRYRYEAVDAAGEVLRDELEAISVDVAVEHLRDRGLLPLSVNEAKGGRERSQGRFVGRWRRSAVVQQTPGIIPQSCRLVDPAIG